MSTTAKEIAIEMGLSQTAVSMALNNRPGVSTETRKKVLNTALRMGYDFDRLHLKAGASGSIYFIFYRTSNAILSYQPIFDEILEGVQMVCRRAEYPVRILQLDERNDNLEKFFSGLKASDCAGILLLGTEMKREALKSFLSLNLPLTLIDTFFDSLPCNAVLINNYQGAYLATDYLIGIYRQQPGYLKSAYSIPNFEERSRGFFRAITDNGMSRSRCIIHELSPSIDNAMADMLELADRKEPLARCYFADNDIIAVGAIKALKLRGYRIPEDVAVIGFDNISEGKIIEPALTTMDVPRLYLGKTAAKNLLDQIGSAETRTSKTEVAPSLIKRFSV